MIFISDKDNYANHNKAGTTPNEPENSYLYAVPTSNNISAADNTHSSAMKTAAYSTPYTAMDGHLYTALKMDNSDSHYTTPNANVKEHVYTTPTTRCEGSTSAETSTQYTTPSVNATEDMHLYTTLKNNLVPSVYTTPNINTGREHVYTIPTRRHSSDIQ